MLTVLALADPARIGTRARWMRLSITLILSLLAVALLSSVVLITELVRGAVTNSAARSSPRAP